MHAVTKKWHLIAKNNSPLIDIYMYLLNTGTTLTKYYASFTDNLSWNFDIKSCK